MSNPTHPSNRIGRALTCHRRQCTKLRLAAQSLWFDFVEQMPSQRISAPTGVRNPLAERCSFRVTYPAPTSEHNKQLQSIKQWATELARNFGQLFRTQFRGSFCRM